MPTTAHSVTRWVTRHAAPVDLGDDAVAPDPGGAPARASVLGVAATTRLSGELTVMARLLLRSAVEDHGFRAVLVEGTDGPHSASAARLDRYVTTGEGDPAALLRSAQGFLHTRQTLDLVAWLRSWAVRHPEDPVRVVHGTGPAAPVPTDLAGTEEELARLALEWHGRTGQRVVHWGGPAHLVAASPRILGELPGERGASAGHLLRAELGHRYALVALTFGGGALLGHPVPPPAPDLVESAFADVPHEAFTLDLGHLDGSPDEVVRWWRRTSRLRCVGPRFDPGNEADAWVEAPGRAPVADAFAHVARVTPPLPL